MRPGCVPLSWASLTCPKAGGGVLVAHRRGDELGLGSRPAGPGRNIWLGGGWRAQGEAALSGLGLGLGLELGLGLGLELGLRLGLGVRVTGLRGDEGGEAEADHSSAHDEARGRADPEHAW